MFEQYDHDVRAALLALAEQDTLRAALCAAVPVPPCPAWCTLPAGHRWDSMDPTDSSPCRSHTRDFGPVEVAMWEYARDGGIEREPAVVVAMLEDPELSADQAGELAAGLLTAAAFVHAENG